MADIVSSIKKIAKTNELTQKVDKLIQESNPVAKGALQSARLVSTPSIAGAGDVAAGAAAGTASDVIMYDINGNPIQDNPAQATKPTPRRTDDNSNTDNNNTKKTDDNTDSKNKDDPTNTDQSDKGKDTGDTGGSGYKGGSGNSDDDADWQAIEAAMRERGATEEEIADAKRKYFNQEPGIDEVGDVYNGDAGAQLPGDDDGGKAPGDQSSSGSSQVQRGYVGVDPKDDSKTLLVRVDGVMPTPTDADAAADGQLPWEDPYSPPVKDGWQFWYQGYYYKVTGALGTITGPNPKTVAQQFAELYVGQTAGTDYIKTVEVSDYQYTDTAPGLHPYAFTMTLHYHNIITDAPTIDQQIAVVISLMDCSLVFDAEACAFDNPLRETRWPRTKVGAIIRKDGKFGSNPYDSEAPIEHRETDMSSVRIKSMKTGDTYLIENAINGGFMLSKEDGGGHVLVYGANRTLTAVVDASLKKFYTPR